MATPLKTMIEPSIHCFILLIKDSYVRLSFDGVNGYNDGIAYCEGLQSVNSIDYMGALYKVSDMDRGDRTGTRVVGESTLVSCKHLGCLRSFDESKKPKYPFIEGQRRGFHRVLDKQRRALDVKD